MTAGFWNVGLPDFPYKGEAEKVAVAIFFSGSIFRIETLVEQTHP